MVLPVVLAEKVAAGGDAIGHLADGRVVFIAGALPGERVEVDVHTTKRDFAKAAATRVLEASPDRVVPPCPELAKGCGGCSWQHISPAGQLRLKRDIVADALRRTAHLPEAEVAIAGAVPPWGYRTSLRLAVAQSGRVGLRAARSHQVVPLDQCPIAHPRLGELLADIRVRGADELSLRIGVAGGERSAWPDRDGAEVAGLPDDVGVGPGSVVHEIIGGRRLRVSAPSFFQSGPPAAELLVAAVRAAAAGQEGTLIDAYGGVGLFAATVPARSTVLVESSASACADARVNLADQAATVVEARVEAWQPVRADLVVADPSRAGLGRDAVARLAGTEAGVLVLVSCDPVSLARDTTLLAACGYRHAGSQVLDLFPHTPHVEVVTRFELVGGL